MGLYGLQYAYGPRMVLRGIPASAFSEGDLLCYNSASSLSRINPLMVSGNDICGVALSASTASYQNFVEYIVPLPGTVFMSEATTGSQMTAGEELDFEYTSNRFMVTTSVDSVRAVIVRGTQDISQSVRSQVLISLIAHAGNLELS